MTEYVYPRVEYIKDPHRTHGGSPYNYPVQSTKGMELRDAFAIAAFGAAVGSSTGMGDCTDDERREMWKQLAVIIYEGADAMIEQRKATK